MKLTAEKIADAVHKLAETERHSAIEDILIDLRDSLKQGRGEDDLDTWDAGFRAAIETITANYGA